MCDVKIFGLQGSGTNFLEWTIRNNFIGINYDINKTELRNVKGDVHFGKKLNLKHCYPKLDVAEIILIIQRPFDEWINSKRVTSSSYTKETYDYYYDTPYRENWPTNKFLHINHKWAVNNYHELLVQISEKTECDIKKNWKQPEYRLDISDGKKMTDEIYEY